MIDKSGNVFSETITLDDFKVALKSLVLHFKNEKPKAYEKVSVVNSYFAVFSHLKAEDVYSFFGWVKKTKANMPLASDCEIDLAAMTTTIFEHLKSRVVSDIEQLKLGFAPSVVVTTFVKHNQKYDLDKLKLEDISLSDEDSKLTFMRYSLSLGDLKKLAESPKPEKIRTENSFQDIEGNWHEAVLHDGNWYQDECGVWLPKFIDTVNGSHLRLEYVTSASEPDGVHHLLRRKVLGRKKQGKKTNLSQYR